MLVTWLNGQADVTERLDVIQSLFRLLPSETLRDHRGQEGKKLGGFGQL